MTNQRYCVGKGLKKGGTSFVLSLIPVVVGALGGVLSDPRVLGDLKHGWPAIPAAVGVGLLTFLLNWLKKR